MASWNNFPLPLKSLTGAVAGGLLGAALGGTMEAIARHKEGWNGFTGNRNKAWLREHQIEFMNNKSLASYTTFGEIQESCYLLATVNEKPIPDVMMFRENFSNNSMSGRIYFKDDPNPIFFEERGSGSICSIKDCGGAINYGDYEIVNSDSPKFKEAKYSLPSGMNGKVPEVVGSNLGTRSGIRFHSGKDFNYSQGCPIVNPNSQSFSWKSSWDASLRIFNKVNNSNLGRLSLRIY